MKPKVPGEGEWKIGWWLFGLFVPKQGKHSQNRAAPDSTMVFHTPAPPCSLQMYLSLVHAHPHYQD